MDTYPRFPPDELAASIVDALVREGVPPEIAAIEAKLAVDADLQGVPSHGLRLFVMLLAGIRNGSVHSAPDLRVLRDHAAICMIDGDHGPGRYLSVRAMEAAIDRARKYGIGACLAAHTSHWGRAHAYAELAARAGMIGICTTNAKATMACWGSRGPVIGNNPVAIGIPGPGPDEPVVFDMAMSVAAVGKVATFLREGKSVPDTWGIDAEGLPTNDAAAVLAGAVLPAAGHKGAGLALMMQLMTAALAGGLLDHELTVHDRSGIDTESSKLFIALDVEAFVEPETFRARAAALAAWLGTRTGGGEEGFRWPGERGRNEAARNLRSGVPLHPEIVALLESSGVGLPRALGGR